jgi:D-alanine-D-alanine ligase
MMRIAVLANLKKNAPKWEGMSGDQWDDLDSPRTAEAIVAALQGNGHEAVFVEASIHAPHNVIERLREFQPDLCFNISESHFGDARESQIPALLEMLRIPYTGSKVLTLALALDKPMTKRILLYHGLPTPEFQVFERADEAIDADLLNGQGELRFPMFVKPSREGTSMGVTAQSIVRSVAELRTQIARQIGLYNEPILVEHYIQGREITVGIVGNLEPTSARRVKEGGASSELPDGLTFLPLMEVDLTYYAQSEADLYTNRIKTEWADDFKYACPAKVEPGLEHQLKVLAANVFRVLDCKDVARVDFRVETGNGNKPYILEINPLPGLNPDLSDLWFQARAAGWSYETLINTVVELAAKRQGVVVPA